LNIGRRLIELVGDAGRRVHAGRSRNDQVALDLRLWTSRRRAPGTSSSGSGSPCSTRRRRFRATRHRRGGTPRAPRNGPSRARLAYAGCSSATGAAGRLPPPRGRLAGGSGACAGTTLPLDRVRVARRRAAGDLANSLDAVSTATSSSSSGRRRAGRPLAPGGRPDSGPATVRLLALRKRRRPAPPADAAEEPGRPRARARARRAA
jgi:argininosuccinate lyase